MHFMYVVTKKYVFFGRVIFLSTVGSFSPARSVCWAKQGAARGGAVAVGDKRVAVYASVTQRPTHCFGCLIRGDGGAQPATHHASCNPLTRRNIDTELRDVRKSTSEYRKLNCGHFGSTIGQGIIECWVERLNGLLARKCFKVRYFYLQNVYRFVLQSTKHKSREMIVHFVHT